VAEAILVVPGDGGRSGVAAHLVQQVSDVLVVLVQSVFLEKLTHLRISQLRHIRDTILLYLAPQHVVHLLRDVCCFTSLELGSLFY